MRNLFQIMTVRGMPVRLHYSWLIAALIGVPLLATVTIPNSMPDSSAPARILLALLIFVIFLGAVAVHELAHLLVARLIAACCRAITRAWREVQPWWQIV